jgi:hypothetical protein
MGTQERGSFLRSANFHTLELSSASRVLRFLHNSFAFNSFRNRPPAGTLLVKVEVEMVMQSRNQHSEEYERG